MSDALCTVVRFYHLYFAQFCVNDTKIIIRENVFKAGRILMHPKIKYQMKKWQNYCFLIWMLKMCRLFVWNNLSKFLTPGFSFQKQEQEREVTSLKWTKVLLSLLSFCLVLALGGLCVLGLLCEYYWYKIFALFRVHSGCTLLRVLFLMQSRNIF